MIQPWHHNLIALAMYWKCMKVGASRSTLFNNCIDSYVMLILVFFLLFDLVTLIYCILVLRSSVAFHATIIEFS